jgi:hypothetical protein
MRVVTICLIFFTLLTAGRCRKIEIIHHTVCDSTVIVPVFRDSLRIKDSLNITDSINFQDSIVFRDSVIFRDSVLVSDTVRLVEAEGHNLYIFGNGARTHTTFYIDLDSIKVTIENGKIIDAWLRPARIE